MTRTWWRANRASVMVAVITCGFTLVLADIAVDALRPPPHPALIAEAAKRRNQAFDHRSKLEIVRDLRSVTPGTVPFFNAMDYLSATAQLGIVGTDEVPLSGLSLSHTVNCNESGAWSTYESDRHGFNKPDGLWDDSVAVVMLGDSFAMGQCVDAGKDAISVLRARGWAGVSLGYSGNGPLTTYATFVEYAVPLRPSVVIWLLYDNDPSDLRGERRIPQLMRYVEKNARSDWVNRTLERDAMVRRALTPVIEGTLQLYPELTRAQRVRAHLTLFHIRTLARRIHRDRVVLDDDAQALFRELLLRVRDQVASWGGTLVLVRAPSWEYFSSTAPASRTLVDFLDATVAEAGTPYFDAAAAIASSDPWPAFAQREAVSAHYSEEGYRRLAFALDSVLRAERAATQARLVERR